MSTSAPAVPKTIRSDATPTSARAPHRTAPRSARVEAPRREASSDDSFPMEKQQLLLCTVPQLKEMLRERGLKVGGRKAELIERLSE